MAITSTYCAVFTSCLTLAGCESQLRRIHSTGRIAESPLAQGFYFMFAVACARRHSPGHRTSRTPVAHNGTREGQYSGDLHRYIAAPVRMRLSSCAPLHIRRMRNCDAPLCEMPIPTTRQAPLFFIRKGDGELPRSQGDCRPFNKPEGRAAINHKSGGRIGELIPGLTMTKSQIENGAWQCPFGQA